MYSRVYLDTAPIIYFLEGSSLYAESVKQFIFEALYAGSTFFTSVATDVEYLTLPLRNAENQKIQAYRNLQEFLELNVIEINREIALSAAHLRANYSGLKSMDAIQLASCVYMGCDAFLTNDKQLLQVGEVHSVLVDDL